MVLGGSELNKNSTLTVGSSSPGSFEGSSTFQEKMEAKGGKLKLFLSRDQNHQPQHIVLRLYAAVPYPFAVVLPDKLICRKHCGLLQLKNFSVETVGDRDFTVVIQNEMEGGKYLRFSVDSREARDSWVNAFQHISMSHNTRRNSCGKSRHFHQNINSRLSPLTEVSEEVEAEEEQRPVLRSCENISRENANVRRPLTPRRRIVEAPSLEQISEEEGEEEDSDTEMEFAISNSFENPSPLSDFERQSRTTGRSV